MDINRTVLRLGLLLGAICSSLAFLVNKQDVRSLSARRHSDQITLDECATFTEDPEVAKEMGTAYVDVGDFSLVGDVDISLDVLPDRYWHNGVLFAVGTGGFRYYEFGEEFLETQFMVIEFTYSSLSLTLKALGHERLLQFELFKTYPNPYSIDDGHWHHIHVTRDSEAERWHMSLDNNTRSDPVTGVTDIQMQNLPGYIGGRPEYRALQFNGVIKNLVVNRQPVVLTDRQTNGQSDVWHCSAPDVLQIIADIQREPTQRNPFGPF